SHSVLTFERRVSKGVRAYLHIFYKEREGTRPGETREGDREAPAAKFPYGTQLNMIEQDHRRVKPQVLSDAGVQEIQECESNIERNQIGKKNKKRTFRPLKYRHPGALAE